MKRFFVVLVSLVIAIATPMSTYALTEAQLDMFAQNNILFYDPEGAEIADCAFGTIAGSTLYEKVLTFLLSLGLTKEAAAGIYGNMMREGLGSAGLLEHEDGVDSRDDIGTWYRAATYAGENGLYVQEIDVRGLDDPSVMHGLGFIQWSFERRVNLLNYLANNGGLDRYAREWDDTEGRYVYDGKSYDTLVGMIGQSETDKILHAELNFFDEEHSSSTFNVRQNDIDAQGLAQYGVTAGMPLYDALNLLPSINETTELFFTTSEMPGKTQFGSDADRRLRHAQEGLDLINSAGLTAAGVTNCGEGGNALAEMAIKLAWPNEDGTCNDGGRMIDWSQNPDACYDDIKPSYRDAMISVTGHDQALTYYQDCGHFIATVVRVTGIDTDFPLGGTVNMLPYMISSDKWQEIANLGNTSNLLPGDIMIVYNSSYEAPGHIMMYTGDYLDGYDLASASYHERTGNMGRVYYGDWRGEYRIFRFVGGD